MAQQPLRIVVVGAGYAGMLATVRLAGKVRREIQRGNVVITLVNAVDVFVERLRLHQLAANQPIPHRPITDILRGTGVPFMRGVVTGINVARHTIEVQTDAAAKQIMRSISHPEIYAVGDAAHPLEAPGVSVRMAAFTAAVMGAHGADCWSVAL